MPSPGVSTQLVSTNIEASAPSRPSCSEPAMGWPPTNRLSSTADTTGTFTLPTSVTSPVGEASSALHTASAMCATGVATNVTSAAGSHPAESMAPISRAIARRASSLSTPLTCQLRSRRAKPIEPPMRPTPTTVARPLMAVLATSWAAPELGTDGLPWPSMLPVAPSAIGPVCRPPPVPGSATRRRSTHATPRDPATCRR